MQLSWLCVYTSPNIFRVLAEFQSRKAHRVQIRDKDLLKYLLFILFVVVGYMAAWTAVTIDNTDDLQSLIQYGYTPDDNLSYAVCQSRWRDYDLVAGGWSHLSGGWSHLSRIEQCTAIRLIQKWYSHSSSSLSSHGQLAVGAGPPNFCPLPPESGGEVYPIQCESYSHWIG